MSDKKEHALTADELPRHPIVEDTADLGDIYSGVSERLMNEFFPVGHTLILKHGQDLNKNLPGKWECVGYAWQRRE